MWLVPINFDIGGSIGVLALNCIVGEIFLIVKIFSIPLEIAKIATGN
ncbi:MAG: hypothetical protein NC412_05115 [Roseburia sp.]|nr:hypothetical protein [Roseburia sp.]MCM1277606.1 hypothetical protein [Robinsoniella sp.]